jgi:acetoin utilization deacetylase AcuC-like enzyme
MAVLLLTDPRCVEHDTGPHHPERPARMGAALDGIDDHGLREALVVVEPERASRDDLLVVHRAELVDRLEAICRGGGGHLDPDTLTVPASWDAALLAAGAGLTAAEALRSGAGDAAFCVVRPPGHHATRDVAMGFCLLNNVAVLAANLADRGERVLIADFDAHHGNGTQDVFYDDPRVLFVSWHQWPLYPGTGRVEEIGEGPGEGTTINIPMPPGATAEHYRRTLDEVVRPAIEAFAPTWLLVSAGFDGHRDDPLASLGLTSGDFADLTRELLESVPAGRTVVFLEGGYDLGAVARSTAATIGSLLGEDVRPERASAGGPGEVHATRLRQFHERNGILARG